MPFALKRCACAHCCSPARERARSRACALRRLMSTTPPSLMCMRVPQGACVSRRGTRRRLRATIRAARAAAVSRAPCVRRERARSALGDARRPAWHRPRGWRSRSSRSAHAARGVRAAGRMPRRAAARVRAHAHRGRAHRARGRRAPVCGRCWDGAGRHGGAEVRWTRPRAGLCGGCSHARTHEAPLPLTRAHLTRCHLRARLRSGKVSISSRTIGGIASTRDAEGAASATAQQLQQPKLKRLRR